MQSINRASIAAFLVVASIVASATSAMATTVSPTASVETMTDDAVNAALPIILYLVAAAVGFALLSFAVKRVIRFVKRPGAAPV